MSKDSRVMTLHKYLKCISSADFRCCVPGGAGRQQRHLAEFPGYVDVPETAKCFQETPDESTTKHWLVIVTPEITTPYKVCATEKRTYANKFKFSII